MNANSIMRRRRSELVVLFEGFNTMLIFTYVTHKKQVALVLKIELGWSGTALSNH